jgi:hypothetical protein
MIMNLPEKIHRIPLTEHFLNMAIDVFLFNLPNGTDKTDVLN